MIDSDTCTVCGACPLSQIGRREIRVVQPPMDIQQGGANAILQHVVGRDSVFTATLLCKSCRHIFLTPKFDEAELELRVGDNNAALLAVGAGLAVDPE